MNQKTFLALLLACASTLAFVQPGLAGPLPVAPIAALAASAPAPSLLPTAPVLAASGADVIITADTCTVSVECANGTTVFCNGETSCTTSGTNNRCVTCDGVQQGCCDLTCCEQCELTYEGCIVDCDVAPRLCNACEMVYDHCVNRCGGCP